MLPFAFGCVSWLDLRIQPFGLCLIQMDGVFDFFESVQVEFIESDLYVMSSLVQWTPLDLQLDGSDEFLDQIY